MQKKSMELILLIIVIGVFIAMNYKSLDSFAVKNFDIRENIVVERVVDGDTVVVNGTSVRMLGINTPEKGEKYYSDAKLYTESLVMNKSLIIERRGKDKYERDLAYLFDETGEVNINLEIVKAGYANAYFPEGREGYYVQFFNAWKDCIEKDINLCERSEKKCSECILVKQFGPEEDLILYNSCDFECNITGWSVKDEGRKKFVFGKFFLKGGNQVRLSGGDFNESYVWTNTGDTLFLRDNEGKLVLWKNY